MKHHGRCGFTFEIDSQRALAMHIDCGSAGSTFLKQTNNQVMCPARNCIVKGSPPKAIDGETVYTTPLQGVIDPVQMLWLAAGSVLAENMEEVLSLLSLLLDNAIIWVFRQQSKHELELLLVHRVLHSEHQVVPFVKHEVRQALLAVLDGDSEH